MKHLKGIKMEMFKVTSCFTGSCFLHCYFQLIFTTVTNLSELNTNTNIFIFINPLKPSGHYMYHQFNIQQFYALPTQCIYVFCVDLRTNSDYFPIQR